MTEIVNTVKRSIKSNFHHRKLPVDARQYEKAPNSPWSFPAEVPDGGMCRRERLIPVKEFISAPVMVKQSGTAEMELLSLSSLDLLLLKGNNLERRGFLFCEIP